MKKRIIIGITTSIVITTSITLVAVNIGEITIFKQEITNIINSRERNDRQRERPERPETNRNRRPLETQIAENIEVVQDTTQNEEEEIFTKAEEEE